jgi:DNA-binding transcriptional LysR family regulator
MDLKHLRTFVAIAECGTVSKAALRLHTAQPALSRQIIDLEKELGIALFDRIGRRLRLTAEGEQFLGNCRDLLGQAGALADPASSTSSSSSRGSTVWPRAIWARSRTPPRSWPPIRTRAC